MILLDGIILQIAPLSSNLAIAAYQHHKFDVLHESIDHTKWSWGYVLGCLPMLALIPLLHWVAVWVLLAAWCMHFPVFSVSLNLFRHKAWDYRNTTDPNGSKWDKWLGKYYDEAIFGSMAVWVFLQFLIFKK